MNNFETELIGAEIGHFAHPRRSKTQWAIDFIVFVAAMTAAVKIIVWFATK